MAITNAPKAYAFAGRQRHVVHNSDGTQNSTHALKRRWQNFEPSRDQNSKLEEWIKARSKVKINACV